MIDSSRRKLLKGLFVASVSLLATAACDQKPTGGTVSAAPAIVPPAAEKENQDDREYKIAWSVWTGWMPFELMEEKGFLAARARENGVRVKLVKYKGYTDSVKDYTETKVDGVAMTSMESLQPASQGVSSVGILVNDVSNGGDGVLARGSTSLKDLKGKTVLLEEFSVSHYLLGRALERAGLKESDVKIKNTPGDEAGTTFMSDKTVPVVVTWNPHLFKATEAGKGKVIFSSRDIPGEIVDFLVVADGSLKRSPGLGKALVDAWYDAMTLVTDPKTRPDALRIMAQGAEVSVEDFEKMLADTDLYTDRAKCAAFLGSDTLKDTMQKVQRFSFDHRLIKDDRFKIGFGAAGWEKLRFDPSFVSGHK